VIPGLSFFAFSVINVREAHSYPLQITQTVKSPEEKAASKAKFEAKKNTEVQAKKKRGRPKGSKNKDKKDVVLNPDLLRIQKSLQTFLDTLKGKINLIYLALDGHFGNYPSAFMVLQAGLHLISKLRSDAAMYETCFVEEHKKRGPKPKYGAKLDLSKIDPKYLKESLVEGRMQTDIYQGQFLNKEFAFALNVVIILKTNLDTGSIAHVILFSTDLDLAYDRMIKFYSLRFQLEFNFRDAKQYWGLEDFMNVKGTAVTNAANLSFFMVNFSYALLKPFRKHNREYSILDLKSHYRGLRYASETIKMLPQKPDGILLAEIFQQIARLGAIHTAFLPVSSQ
jgi:putative transposase